jgi:major type 1 subunit fimbrin (pilin)
MKRTFIALALLASTAPALADSGTIQFRGQINGTTCPIDIVDPITGAPVSLINLGTFSTANFDRVGARTPDRPFALWIRDGAACNFTPGAEVDVVYNGLDGDNGDLYLPKAGPSAAGNVGIAITDRTRADVKPGQASAKYPVNETGETLLAFNANIVSTQQTVTAGAVDADIAFLVNIP